MFGNYGGFGESLVGLLICSLVGVTVLIAGTNFSLVGFMFAQLLATITAVVLFSYSLVYTKGSFKSLLFKSSIACILMPILAFGVYFIYDGLIGYFDHIGFL